MDLLCCVCLQEQAGRAPAVAVTLIGGDAICREHALGDDGREVTR